MSRSFGDNESKLSMPLSFSIDMYDAVIKKNEKYYIIKGYVNIKPQTTDSQCSALSAVKALTLFLMAVVTLINGPVGKGLTKYYGCIAITLSGCAKFSLAKSILVFFMSSYHTT